MVERHNHRLQSKGYHCYPQLEYRKRGTLFLYLQTKEAWQGNRAEQTTRCEMRYIIKCVDCHRPAKIIKQQSKDYGTHIEVNSVATKCCNICGGKVKVGLE